MKRKWVFHVAVVFSILFVLTCYARVNVKAADTAVTATAGSDGKSVAITVNSPDYAGKEVSVICYAPGWNKNATDLEGNITYVAVFEQGTLDKTGKLTANYPLKDGFSKGNYTVVIGISGSKEIKQCEFPVGIDVAQGQKDTKIPVSNIKVKATKFRIAAGKKIALSPKIEPANATNKNLVYTISNKKYASVNVKGVVKTKKAGAGKKVVVKAAAADGSGKFVKVTVRIMKNAVTKVSLKAVKKVKAGKKIKVKAIVKTNGNKANKTLSWVSSNTKIATVNTKGVVKTKKSGAGKTVTITASSTDGTNKRANIKIKLKK